MSTAKIDKPAQRNNYFDFLRALAIIMVIGNHTSNVADFSFPTGIGNIIILQIIKAGVPIFLAISAFFLCPRIITGKKQYIGFLTKHLKRVYIPMLIFSLPFIFGNGLGLKSVLGRTVLSLFGAYSVYYFIFLIAQYYLLLPVMQRKAINMKGLAICALISGVSILIVTYCNSILDMDLPLFIYAGFCPVWIYSLLSDAIFQSILMKFILAVKRYALYSLSVCCFLLPKHYFWTCIIQTEEELSFLSSYCRQSSSLSFFRRNSRKSITAMTTL